VYARTGEGTKGLSLFLVEPDECGAAIVAAPRPALYTSGSCLRAAGDGGWVTARPSSRPGGARGRGLLGRAAHQGQVRAPAPPPRPQSLRVAPVPYQYPVAIAVAEGSVCDCVRCGMRASGTAELVFEGVRRRPSHGRAVPCTAFDTCRARGRCGYRRRTWWGRRAAPSGACARASTGRACARRAASVQLSVVCPPGGSVTRCMMRNLEIERLALAAMSTGIAGHGRRRHLPWFSVLWRITDGIYRKGGGGGGI
jgi:hypothetical protein